jgi:hypothetical protein
MNNEINCATHLLTPLGTLVQISSPLALGAIFSGAQQLEPDMQLIIPDRGN